MSSYFSLALQEYVSSYTGLNKNCWQGIMLCFAVSTLSGVYYFLPLYFVNELKIDVVMTGVITSCYGLGAVIGGLLGGRLSDRTSPKLVSLACLAVQGLIYFGLIYIKNPYVLTISLFIMGIASYGYITSNFLWVLASCEGDENVRLKAINLLSVASNLGFAFAAIIVGTVSDFGYHNIFIFSSIVFVLLLLYFSTLKNSAPGSINAAKNHTDIMAANSQKNVKIFYLVLGCLFFAGLNIFQLGNYTIYIANNFPDYGVKGVSILFTFNCILICLLQNPLLNALRNNNKMVIVGAGAFLLGLGRLLLCVPSTFEIAVLSCVVWTLGEILFFSVAQLICYESGGASNKGKILGIYRMVYAGSRFAAPAIGAFVYQVWGASNLWILCGVFGIISLILCLYHKNDAAYP